MSTTLIPFEVQRWQRQAESRILGRWQQGLQFLVLPGLGWGYPESALTAPTTNSTFYADIAYGQAYRAGNQAGSWNTTCSLGNEYTLLCIAMPGANATSYAIMDDGATPTLSLRTSATVGKWQTLVTNTGAAQFNAIAATAAPATSYNTGMVVGAQVSSHLGFATIWQLGVKASVVTSGTLRSPTNIRIGASKTASPATNTIALAAGWNYVMPDGDLAQLLANPYQIFEPRPRRLFFGTASSGFSGTPGLSSLVKTGQVPGLTTAFEFVPGVSSLDKTGKVPSAAIGVMLSPIVGDLIKTGEIPTLTRTFHFTPTVGDLVKSGQVPTLTRKFTFTPLTATLSKTGHATTLYAPMTPTAASLVKTGEIPNLTISGQTTAGKTVHSWFVKGIGVKTKVGVKSQVDSDTGDTP